MSSMANEVIIFGCFYAAQDNVPRCQIKLAIVSLESVEGTECLQID